MLLNASDGAQGNAMVAAERQYKIALAGAVEGCLVQHLGDFADRLWSFDDAQGRIMVQGNERSKVVLDVMLADICPEGLHAGLPKGLDIAEQLSSLKDGLGSILDAFFWLSKKTRDMSHLSAHSRRLGKPTWP